MFETNHLSPTTMATNVQLSEASNQDSTEKEFEDILNQLNALGHTIDQELSSYQQNSSSNIHQSPSKLQSSSNYQSPSSTSSPYHYSSTQQQPPSSPYHQQTSTTANVLENPSSTTMNKLPPSGQNTTATTAMSPQEYYSSSAAAAMIHQHPSTYIHHQTAPPPPSPHHTQMHHYHHYHHYQPHVDSGEANSSQTNTGGGHSLARTDSPDNDSAFSDTISLISSEQSSSSASSNGVGKVHGMVRTNGTNSTSSGQSSQSVNSSCGSSSSSCDDNGANGGNMNHTQQQQQQQQPQSSSSSPSSKMSSTPTTMTTNKLSSPTTTTNNGIVSMVSADQVDSSSVGTTIKQQQQQQQLLFEQNMDKNKDSEDDSNELDQSNGQKHCLMIKDEQDRLVGGMDCGEDNDDDGEECQKRFELIANIITEIDLQFAQLTNYYEQQDEITEPNQLELINSDRITLMMDNSVSGDGNHDDNDDNGPPTPKNIEPNNKKIDYDDPITVGQVLGDTLDNSSTLKRNKTKQEEIDEKIRVAMEKIREANIRKLYLKVFAEDDSSKCLLADERMTVGTVCQQMAQKNHIAIGMNYCIMEHMPLLYLERFYEDHESLVENVLYWGRDHQNKLYFVQQPDKYDMFVQPEKYLISVSQPNENVDTLKSGSLRAKYNANQLRADLIAQFFNSSSNGVTGTGPGSGNSSVRVPEIEGNLYLRSEGKKVWKKYFFSLRASGLYYCPKGKPKSTKDLICLTTFELNCIYYGFGWKKKFKAPNDYGFAIKHPQIQMKSPKHIKYLCAENQDDLKLWITGIRIAKYGRQLLDNYDQFKMNHRHQSLSSNSVDDLDSSNKKITTFPLNDSTNDLQSANGFVPYGDPVLARTGSITMRTNRCVPRSDSIRSSSASSSSGCMSEQSSVVSTPSSGGSTTDQSNYHHPSPHHHHQMNGVVHSPHHHPHGLNGFEGDFPSSLGTIKRKPNVMIQPKIPLTTTTRNLALQSDDALLEVNDACSNNGNANNYGNDEDGTGSCCSGMNGPSSLVNSPHHNGGEFQRGTFKNGTLRRSMDHHHQKQTSKMMSALLSPQHHPIYGQSSPLIKTVPEMINHHSPSVSDDDLPPPPPPSTNLKEAESTLSLNASFPPPPPPEVLDGHHHHSSSPNSVSMSNIPSQTNGVVQPSSNKQQPNSPTTPTTMMMKPPSMASLPLPPMTPQPQIKNRLARRLSDLSENSTYFMNFRSNYDGSSTAGYPGATAAGQQPQMLYSPHSRASIASSADSTSFVTLKSNNFLNGRRGFQRQHSIDYYQQQQQPQAWSKYGTSPRLRQFDHHQQQATMNSQPQIDQQFYNQNRSTSSNYAPFVPPPMPSIGNGNIVSPAPPPSSSSHCAIVSENVVPPPMGVMMRPTEYDIPPTRVKVFQQFQPPPQQNPMLAPPQTIPPPPPLPSAVIDSQANGHYGTGNYQVSSPAHHPTIQSQQPRENHYMSISPHLLQKHQQMLQKQQQNYYSTGNNGQMPYHVPEDVFLKNMERVMQKKWHVAQMLRQDQTVTPGQVLGFRDSAYLPPPPTAEVQQYNPSPMHHNNSYPSPVPVIESSTPPTSSPYHHRFNMAPTNGKTVQFAPDPMMDNMPMTPTKFGNGKKIPPPPPKRSESTQLTAKH